MEGDSEREFRNGILNDLKMNRVWARRAVGVDALNLRLDEEDSSSRRVGARQVWCNVGWTTVDGKDLCLKGRTHE